MRTPEANSPENGVLAQSKGLMDSPLFPNPPTEDDDRKMPASEQHDRGEDDGTNDDLNLDPDSSNETMDSTYDALLEQTSTWIQELTGIRENLQRTSVRRMNLVSCLLSRTSKTFLFLTTFCVCMLFCRYKMPLFLIRST